MSLIQFYQQVFNFLSGSTCGLTVDHEKSWAFGVCGSKSYSFQANLDKKLFIFNP